MKSKSKNIVFISSIPWHYSWHRQQEIMTLLTKKNFNVLFVQPVNKKKMFTLKLEEVNDRLWILHVPGLPYERCFCLINYLNGKISQIVIEKVIKKLNFSDYKVWFDRIHGCNIKKLMKNNYTIYDLIDEVLAFGRYKNKRLLLKKENLVLQNCDLLISSSKTLMNRKIKQSDRKGINLFLPNGVDYKRFINIPENKSLKNQFIIGFIGTISQRALNYNLIKEVIRIRPEWKFLFIGPGNKADKKMLENMNVKVFDAVEGKDIPQIIKKFDVGIIPYNVEKKEMDYVFPRKACEYLAAGKPVVSTPLKEVDVLRPYVKVANEPNSFVKEIENALADKESCNKRKEFVRKFDSDFLIEMLIKKYFDIN